MLVDRDHISLLSEPSCEPVQGEVQRMSAHDHGLNAASRFDPESFCDPAGDVGIECIRMVIGFLTGNRVSSRFALRVFLRGGR